MRIFRLLSKAAMACLICASSIAEENEKYSIPIEKIGREVVLTGKSGVPIGTTFTALGFWENRDSAHPLVQSTITFTLIEVNGNALKHPVEIEVTKKSSLTVSSGGWNRIEAVEEGVFELYASANASLGSNLRVESTRQRMRSYLRVVRIKKGSAEVDIDEL